MCLVTVAPEVFVDVTRVVLYVVGREVDDIRLVWLPVGTAGTSAAVKGAGPGRTLVAKVTGADGSSATAVGDAPDRRLCSNDSTVSSR